MPASEQQKINAVVPLLAAPLRQRESASALNIRSCWRTRKAHRCEHTWRHEPPALASPENINEKLAAFRLGIFDRNDILLLPSEGSAVRAGGQRPTLNRISSPRADKKEKSHADPPGPPSFHLDLSSPIASNPFFPPHNKVQGGETKTEHETHGGP